jgi:hypothetical protein
MSRSSSAAQPSAKTELETVVNWPLVVSAAALAFVALAVPLVLACIAASKGGVVKDQAISRSAVPQPQPTNRATPTAPAHAPRPPIVPYQAEQRAAPRQVYVKAVQPPIPVDPTPLAVAIKAPPTSPSVQTPVSQLPDRMLPPSRPYLRQPVLQLPDRTTPCFKRFDEMTEAHLFGLLTQTHTVKDVDLESVKGTREKLLAKASKDNDSKRPPILALRAERSDLKGLPMREGAECQARPEDVKKMQEISLTLRRRLDRSGGRASISSYPTFERAELLQRMLRTSKDWFQEDGLSTLSQMLQVEDTSSRSEFVKRLAAVKGAKASVLLARQALFDLSWTIRAEAIEALKERPREDYRQVLLDGLRYPWGPVAAHAAEALAALKDRDSLARLAAMLEEPDPCAPVSDKNKKWLVPEVVRVNHLRNCLLCHAPSTAKTDPLRAAVPTPGQPLPLVYYGSRKGDFVRADITYLRQDFSLLERVAKPDKWPEWQRFDYLVRMRELTAEELAAWKDKARKPASSSYPQREAVLFALRELTGQNAGEKSTDWYDLLYTLELSSEP